MDETPLATKHTRTCTLLFHNNVLRAGRRTRSGIVWQTHEGAVNGEGPTKEYFGHQIEMFSAREGDIFRPSSDENDSASNLLVPR